MFSKANKAKPAASRGQKARAATRSSARSNGQSASLSNGKEMHAEGAVRPDGSAPSQSGSAASMKAKAEGRPSSGVPSIISSDMVLKGRLVTAGEIQFDGEIEGDIFGKLVVIGEGAKVMGELIADKVRVSGTVEGQIRALSVELSTTALVKGDIIHAALSIESGARFEGNCRHSDDPLVAEPIDTLPRVKDRAAPTTTASAKPLQMKVVKNDADEGDTAEAAEIVATADAGSQSSNGSSIDPDRATSRELMPTKDDGGPSRRLIGTDQDLR